MAAASIRNMDATLERGGFVEVLAGRGCLPRRWISPSEIRRFSPSRKSWGKEVSSFLAMLAQRRANCPVFAHTAVSVMRTCMKRSEPLAPASGAWRAWSPFWRRSVANPGRDRARSGDAQSVVTIFRTR
jgi:hypothetical protein